MLRKGYNNFLSLFVGPLGVQQQHDKHPKIIPKKKKKQKEKRMVRVSLTVGDTLPPKPLVCPPPQDT